MKGVYLYLFFDVSCNKVTLGLSGARVFYALIYMVLLIFCNS